MDNLLLLYIATASSHCWCIAITNLGLPSKFRSEKIPRNRLRTVFVISRNKVLIPCDSEYFGRVHSVTRNETERNSAKYWSFNKQITKVIFFPSFYFRKWFREEFRIFICSENDSERNSEVFFFRKWFGTEFRGFFQPKMVRNGIPRVFLFQEMVRNEIPRFFLLRETGGILTELPSVPTCSEFRGIIFLSENGNPNYY
jgi:hypothetical protein